MKKQEIKTRSKRSKSYTPTPLSLGDIREIEVSSLSPLLNRPLPPSKSKSLPGTPLTNSAPLSPTSPTISEATEYSDDYYSEHELNREEEEHFYVTLIKGYEKEKLKSDKEITDLHNNIHRLEADLVNLQTEGEDKDSKLREIINKNQSLIKDNKLLQQEKTQIIQDRKLTDEEYLTETNKNKNLTERLNKEIANSKSLLQRLESQWEENKEITRKQQKLLTQLTGLKFDKNLHAEERFRLEETLFVKEKEYRERLKNLEEKHNKQIQNYRLFNSQEDKSYKRKTLDYGVLARSHSIYLDHSRSDSLSSLTPRTPTLDLELVLQTPKTAKFSNQFEEGGLKSPTLEEEFKKSERLSTTFTDLMTDIDDFEEKRSEVIEISPQAVKELEERILVLTQQQEAYQQRIQQQETMVQDLAQKNILLQEQLATEQDQTKRVKDMEQSLFTLNQNNLEYQRKNNDLQDQLRQTEYSLQSAELKKANYYNFVQSLEETFPLTDKQRVKLAETAEPDIILLSSLKSNIFAGINKLREQITSSRTEIIEVEKQRQQLLSELEEWKEKQSQLEKEVDLSGLKNTLDEFDELTNQIEIAINKKY